MFQVIIEEQNDILVLFLFTQMPQMSTSISSSLCVNYPTIFSSRNTASDIIDEGGLKHSYSQWGLVIKFHELGKRIGPVKCSYHLFQILHG